MEKNFCPVCGFDQLKERVNNNSSSYEICPCCGFEFGFDDDLKGNNYEIYRENWIEDGAQWFIKKQRPENWSLKQQLLNINILYN